MSTSRAIGHDQPASAPMSAFASRPAGLARLRAIGRHVAQRRRSRARFGRRASRRGDRWPSSDEFEPPAGRSLVLASAAAARAAAERRRRLVFKTRITPHWFDQNNRFWYRNDLAGGAQEFILVDAERRDAAAGLRPPEARGRPVEGGRRRRLQGRSSSRSTRSSSIDDAQGRSDSASAR